ncbi:MAG: Fe-S cluster assembly protein SufD [Armatimonadota bacterium]|nr:Fe-S cluster assembly protein SufD [Armatimonadota bacterium]MDR7549822.1 Fe-S cluster assembly protein SufD [Armatimonadota bacterium]
MGQHLAATAAPLALSRSAVQRRSEAMGEPVWALQRRLEAWEAFERLPAPPVTHPEEWRRTDISGLDLGALTLPADGPVESPRGFFGPLAREEAERAGLLTFLDGRPVVDGARLGEEAARAGVLFTDLASAVRAEPDLVRDHLFSLAPRDEHRFRALHAALHSGGTFLYVPRGVEVALPLVTQAWLGTPAGAVFPHTLVVADEGSAVTLVELFGSYPEGPRALASGVVELILRDGAQVRYMLVQEWGAPMWEVGSLIRARLGRDASLRSLVAVLGGGLVKVDVESHLEGPGASSEMLGLYFGADRQHIDVHTLQAHRAPHTTSDLLYRGAVKDAARSVFAGLIRVHHGAQKTNAFQANRNLILSEGARADSIPKLEIMANDLRCTHGSATSRLNEEHIFYLMSRGLTRQQATFMIVEGFFADLFDRTPIPRLRGYLQARIAEKMI